MLAIGNILFVLLYVILFAFWIIVRSYFISMISIAILLLATLPSINRKISLAGFCLIFIFIMDLICSNKDVQNELSRIIEQKCLSAKEWNAVVDNMDMLKREVPRTIGVKRELIYRKHNRVIFADMESSGNYFLPVCTSDTNLSLDGTRKDK